MTSMQIKGKIKYKEGFRFYLADDFFIPIEGLPDVSILETYKISISNGVLKVSRGYMWDGLWKNKKMIRGFLVHEVLLRLIRLGYLDYSWRTKANTILYELLVEDGVFKPVAWLIQRFFDLFGSVSSNGGRKVQTAP